jgi:5-methylcytosine-specific restriction endonuclease McrA
MKRMHLSCFYCGFKPPKGISLDVHHILSKKDNGTDDNENLTYICPNCHRLVHSGIIDKKELRTIAEVVKNDWIEYYYG